MYSWTAGGGRGPKEVKISVSLRQASLGEPAAHAEVASKMQLIMESFV